ncbi:chloramphenicol acetyltransferase [Bacillus cereus]|nr:chloramphenicol acetyltransferase [Bacillus cereus]
MVRNYKSVDCEYKRLIKDYANTTHIAPMGIVPPNVLNISSIPWMHFEHFCLIKELSKIP